MDNRDTMPFDFADMGHLLHAIIDASADYIYVKDLELKTVLCNRIFARALGKEPDELLGKTDIENGWDPRYVKGDSDKGIRGYEQDDLRALSGETVHVFEEAADIEGTPHYFDTIKAPLRNSAGDIVALLGISRDVTERKLARERAVDTENRLAAMAGSVPGVIFQFRVRPDGSSYFSYISERCEDLFGLSVDVIKKELMTGTPIPEDEREGFFASIRGAAERRADWEYEGRIICGDGSIKWFQGKSQPVELGGELVFNGILLDVTDKKLAELELEKNRRALLEAQEIAGLGAWEYDVATDTTTWSKEMFRIFGRDEELGSPTWEEHSKLIHPDDWEFVDRTIRAAANEGTPYSIEFRTVHDDGLVMWAWSRGRAEKNERGEIVRIVGTTQDITERKAAAFELEKIQRLESVGCLAGGLAHDFNNLLGGILGNVEEAAACTDSASPAAPYLNNALRAYDRARELTSRLLTFAKGDALTREPLNLRRLVHETVSLALSGSNAQCETDLAEDLCPVEGNMGQLSQVMNNLLLNARESMPGGGLVRVVCKNVKLTDGQVAGLPPGEFVELVIEDEGCGIEEEYLGSVFDPFFTTKAAGTGLGLAMSHSIVRKHGGLIQIESAVGRGTKVSVYLPCSVKPVRPSLPADNGTRPMTGRVLVLDDEELIRDLTQASLEKLGFEVVCASDGRQAVELVRAELEKGRPFDYLLLDLTIPGGYGGERVMAEIRAFDPDVKGIVMSGYAESCALSCPQDYGFSAALAKPFKRQELADVLKRLSSKPV